MNTAWSLSDRQYWIAKVAACSTIIKEGEGTSVIANIATAIRNARKNAENPPEYHVLSRWWSQTPPDEQLRLHETHAGNYLFVDSEAAEDSLANARNLAKAVSMRLIEQLTTIALDQGGEVKDRISAAKEVFRVAGAYQEQPLVNVNVDIQREERFLERLQSVSRGDKAIDVSFEPVKAIEEKTLETLPEPTF